MHDPEFTSFVDHYDIIGLQETKTDSLDNVELKNFDLYFKHRRHISQRKSGGVCLAVKKHISNYLTIIDTDCKSVIWFKLSNVITHCGNVLFGVTYIPPQGSVYADDDPFSCIQTDIDKLSKKYNYLCMFGDWNSRTKELSDYTTLDYDLYHENDLMDLYNELNLDNTMFLNTHVKKERCNIDKSVNNYGYKFIDFLQCNKMFILNGRTNGDYTGNVTCKGASAVDYFVCTSNIFKYVLSLNVLDFSPLLSDVHSPIEVLFNFHAPDDVSTALSNNHVNPTLWDDEKSELFVQNINNADVNDILRTVSVLETLDNVSCDEIDTVVDKICTVFENSCKRSFCNTHNINTHYKTTTRNPKWFNTECKNARKSFHKAKYCYKLRKSEQNKLNLKQTGKLYKKTLNVNYKRFKSENVSKLQKLKHSNPRKFWKTLNKKKHGTVDASLNDLYSHFKHVNSQNEDFGYNANNSNSCVQCVNECTCRNNFTPYNTDVLNSPITLKEVKDAIKSLKLNKASGDDDIRNELIRSTEHFMSDVYVKLFNVVFKNGIVPKSWTIGVINPIFKNKGSANDPTNYRPVTLLSCLGKLFTNILNSRLQLFVTHMILSTSFKLVFESNTLRLTTFLF